MKRFTLLVVTLIFSITLLVPTALANDLKGHWAEKNIQRLVNLKVMNGFPDGTYRPDAPLTRAQFTKLVVEAVKLDKGNDPVNTDGISFKDLNPDEWYYPYIISAVNAGIIKGYDDQTFRPDEKISREQMAVMIERTLDSQGFIVEKGKTLPFTDSSLIGKDYVAAVQSVFHLKIMDGTSKNPPKFEPKKNTTRAMAATVVVRVLDTLNPPPAKLDYQVATPTKDGTNVVKEYATFAEARKNVKSGQVIQKGGKIIWMPAGLGIAAANKFTIVYDDAAVKAQRTYVPTGAEFKYVDATETSVKVELAGKVGYVKQGDANLIPSNTRSYYTKSGGNLVHTIYNPLTGKTASTGVIGKAPAFMAEGQKYYSWDGSRYTDSGGKTVGTSYQYFNVLPLGIKSNYTADELNKYIRDKYPHRTKVYNGKKLEKSPLENTGQYFKEMETKYGVNALYLMAHAIHESDWGTSCIAQEINNLYGMQAYDGEPCKNAKKYNSFKESIEHAAQYVSSTYQKPSGAYFNGAVLGNKAIGMNVKYASDPFWGEKIAGHMYRADQYLGSKDFAKQELGITNVKDLNVRSKAGVVSTDTELYKLKLPGTPIAIKRQVSAGGATWYEIHSDIPKSTAPAYAYGTGSLGEYIKKISVAK